MAILKSTVVNGNLTVNGTSIKKNGTEVSVEGHTHNYAGSTSPGGNASIADSVANPLRIYNNGNEGNNYSLEFNGSEAKYITLGTNLTLANNILSVTSNTFSPVSHAVNSTTYGVGTSSNYGHVKLGDSNQNGATAADGVVAPNGHTHSQYVTSVNNTTPTNGNVAVGTVTSVQVQAGTGLTSSTSTAQSSSLNTTISIADGYKLPTTTEWALANNKPVIMLEENGSTTAGTWKAKTDLISALSEGQLFMYKIAVAGATNTYLNVTCNGTPSGDKQIYRVGTTKLTTQYGVGTYILLYYNGTYFYCINDYDANSYAYVRQYQSGQNAAGTASKYPILTRYNVTNKNGSYDTAYTRFYTDTYIDTTNGYLYAPKLYSGGSEVLTGITSSQVTTALGYTPGTSNLALGDTSTTAAAGNHNHALNIATAATGTSSSITLSHDGRYTLEAGGKTFTFTMPSVSAGTIQTISFYEGNQGSSIYNYDGSTAMTIVNGAGISMSASQNQVTLGVAANTYAPYNSNGYLPLNGGTVTGDFELYNDATGSNKDTPRLTFKRGTLTDSYNDWSMYDSGGYLYIQQRGSGSTAWENRAIFMQGGVDLKGTISEGGTLLSNKYAAKSHDHSRLSYSTSNPSAAADSGYLQVCVLSQSDYNAATKRDRTLYIII